VGVVMSTPQLFEPIGLIVPAQHAPVADLFPGFDRLRAAAGRAPGCPILRLT
jgi:hypothetical protein